jgi:S1-C subfamily serine protease
MSRHILMPAGWILTGVLATTLYFQRQVDSPAPLLQAASMVMPAAVEFPSSTGEQAPATYTPEEQSNIHVYEIANRSVVNIDTQTEQIDPLFMRRVPGAGSGSGSVLDKEGHILTNSHVIENAKAIEVTLATGETYHAELIGQDREHDIAVLKIDAPSDELYPLELGRSDGLRVGQHVYALGNPFGLEGSLTKGIISSLNRSIEGRTGGEMKSLVQTDAAMNPGNSGGPLLDSAARMIGMNVAIATRTGQSAGVGFAIPVNRIAAIVPELIAHGRIVRPDHGILRLREFADRGVKIEVMTPGGPAEKAGLQAIVQVETRRKGGIVYQARTSNVSRGDWIVAVDSHRIKTASDFLATMDGYKPGDQITLTIVRAGEELRVPLTLGAS